MKEEQLDNKCKQSGEKTPRLAVFIVFGRERKDEWEMSLVITIMTTVLS